MIEEYQFGKIQVNGRIYNHDIELRWDGQVLKWWRKESHIIDLEDIARALEQSPDLIIIGTGESGVAQVTERAKEAIASQKIEIIIDITPEAVKTFNIQLQRPIEEDGRPKKVIGLFHLTC